MKIAQRIAVCILSVVALGAAGADLLSTHGYATQYREHANEPPSRQFLLGTDELGRDRLSRLLYGSRVSLVCVPAAALTATCLGAFIGLLGGAYGGWLREATTALTDLFLSLPWLFALLLLRAVLPLHISPQTSFACTFGLLAAVGWASTERVVQATVVQLRSEPALVHARAYGCSQRRLIWRHIAPNLWPVCAAQFWILVPVFLLTEANLGLLGLGLVEPMPSWGNMLAELRYFDRLREEPWILAPAILLVLVIGSLHVLIAERSTWE